MHVSALTPVHGPLRHAVKAQPAGATALIVTRQNDVPSGHVWNLATLITGQSAAVPVAVVAGVSHSSGGVPVMTTFPWPVVPRTSSWLFGACAWADAGSQSAASRTARLRALTPSPLLRSAVRAGRGAPPH